MCLLLKERIKLVFICFLYFSFLWKKKKIIKRVVQFGLFNNLDYRFWTVFWVTLDSAQKWAQGTKLLVQLVCESLFDNRIQTFSAITWLEIWGRTSELKLWEIWILVLFVPPSCVPANWYFSSLTGSFKKTWQMKWSDWQSNSSKVVSWWASP